MDTMLDQHQVINLLRLEVEKLGSQKAVADQYGLSVAYVNDVIHSRRGIGGAIERALGLERVTMWRKPHAG